MDEWLPSEHFHSSFVANAATELRSRPDHPARKVITAHRLALRELLEDLAKAAGVPDPSSVAALLQVLVDGASAVSMLDRRLGVGATIRTLANAALTVASERQRSSSMVADQR